MSKHNFTRALQTYIGGGFFAPMFARNGRNGAPVHLLTKVSLGSPIALDGDGMVVAATGAELPNATTITYTTANDGPSPIDNVATPAPGNAVIASGASVNCWTIDVPRNFTFQVTHATSIVSMSCTITGYDEWGQLMTELLSVTATGTDKTAVGKKAFKLVTAIALTCAGNSQTNTVNVGWADVIGLPYRLASVADSHRLFFNDIIDASAFVVAAV